MSARERAAPDRGRVHGREESRNPRKGGVLGSRPFRPEAASSRYTPPPGPSTLEVLSAWTIVVSVVLALVVILITRLR